MLRFHKLKIKEVKRETKDAVSIAFTIPNNLQKEFQFTAGQYITLKTTIHNEEVRRAYSICSSPSDDEIRVAVKAVKGGSFSIYATTQLKKGDEIEVTSPEGKFILETKTDNTKNYLAFGAGSGITPIMAMIKAVLENETNSKFVLTYGNKSSFETLFFDEINNLKTNYPDRFFVQFVFSKEQPKNALFGRIDTSVVNYVLKKYIDFNFDTIFLCGPEQMIHTVSDTLKEKEFKSENIHFELFTASKTKKNSDNKNISLDGNTEITILLDDEETTFTMAQKTTILESVLKENLDAPYSCQGGICSSCLAKVTQGEAVMDKNTILSDEEVANGLILTCQAHPTTKNITIDYDEV